MLKTKQYRCIDGMCGAIDCFKCGVHDYCECRNCGKDGSESSVGYVYETDLCRECDTTKKNGGGSEDEGCNHKQQPA